MLSKRTATSGISKYQIVVPESVRRCARINDHDEVEFRATPGVITIITKPPLADDEYTFEQRRMLDARLAVGLADVQAGRLIGPFDTHEEMIEFLHAEVAKAKPKAKTKSRKR
jgi:bifunctional DNA-binding transcriptional regulator/antitoxin component of YhaV-PrlF toxin-antitoxin module